MRNGLDYSDRTQLSGAMLLTTDFIHLKGLEGRNLNSICAKTAVLVER